MDIKILPTTTPVRPALRFGGDTLPTLSADTAIANRGATWLAERILDGRFPIDDLSWEELSQLANRLIDRSDFDGTLRKTLITYFATFVNVKHFENKEAWVFQGQYDIVHQGDLKRIGLDVLENEPFCQANPRLHRKLLYYFDALLAYFRDKRLIAGTTQASGSRQDGQNRLKVSAQPTNETDYPRYQTVQYYSLSRLQQQEKALDVLLGYQNQLTGVQPDELPRNPALLKPDELKKLYRFLAARLHPDRNMAPTAGEQLAEITVAYGILTA